MFARFMVDRLDRYTTRALQFLSAHKRLLQATAALAAVTRGPGYVVLGLLAVVLGVAAAILVTALAVSGRVPRTREDLQMAVIDTLGWARDLAIAARRASTAALTVWCDPARVAGRPIALRPPVQLPAGDWPAVCAVRVLPGASAAARRAAAWLYREYSEPAAADWLRCATLAGCDDPPRHVLDLLGDGEVALGLRVEVELTYRGNFPIQRDLRVCRGAEVLGCVAGPAPLGGLTAQGIVRDALRRASGK